MLAPRILIVMSDQWPRALIRASLRQSGYDAIGARSIAEAWTHSSHAERRGDVALILLDQDALAEDRPGAVRDLLHFHGDPPTMLLAHATRAVPEGPWNYVLYRPQSVGDLVAAVERAAPLDPSMRRPLDAEP